MKKNLVMGLAVVLTSCKGPGHKDALSKARAELLAEQWRKEAVYGISDTPKKVARVRRVFVPDRIQNGVRIPGGVQEVMILP